MTYGEPPTESFRPVPRRPRRNMVMWAVTGGAVLVAVVAVLFAAGVFRSGSSTAPWSDERLASELTTQFADIGQTVTADEIPAVLQQDCPHLDDPAALVSEDPSSPAYAGTLADVTAALSLIKQSGRC